MDDKIYEKFTILANAYARAPIRPDLVDGIDCSLPDVVYADDVMFKMIEFAKKKNVSNKAVQCFIAEARSLVTDRERR